MNKKCIREQGATALIIVVFSILLLMTVTVGFLRLTVQDQQRANNSELSRGAYDSALAGVEDGKRVLQACAQQGTGSDACKAISADQCNTVHAAKILSAGDDSTNMSEVKISDSSGTVDGYDQAYTCVKVESNTPDYTNALNGDATDVLPLQATTGFTSVLISWYKKPTSTTVVDSSSKGDLPTLSGWSPANTVRPPMLRVQLMQYYGSFTLSDFDKSGDSNTQYFYPAAAGANATSVPASFTNDSRTSGAVDLQPVACNPNVISGYVCSVLVNLPNPVGMPDNPTSQQLANRVAFLRLTSLYSAGAQTDISVAFGTQGVNFLDVEPSIDSTGRASDVQRRVDARVKQVSIFAYPRAAVDITGNFCKDFGVSDIAYYPGTCTP